MGGNALRIRGIAIVCVAGLLAACGSSTSSDNGTNTASAPGITATTITIGSTQPLTGRAAPGYSEISPSSNAYFQYLNAHGGINGRKITYYYYDDGYNPTNTASLTRKLILEDKVFAMFSALGTPTHQAVVDYINSQKVPDLFVSSGCNCWNDVSNHPYTFGFQPDYTIEGKVLGQYIQQNLSGKKVGYFFQNDEFGLDGVKGLDAQLGASSVPDAARQNYVPTNTSIGPGGRRLLFDSGLHRVGAAGRGQARLPSDLGREQCWFRRHHLDRPAEELLEGRGRGSVARRHGHRHIPPADWGQRESVDQPVQGDPRPVRLEPALGWQCPLRHGPGLHVRAGHEGGGPQSDPSQLREGAGDDQAERRAGARTVRFFVQ